MIKIGKKSASKLGFAIKGYYFNKTDKTPQPLFDTAKKQTKSKNKLDLREAIETDNS